MIPDNPYKQNIITKIALAIPAATWDECSKAWADWFIETFHDPAFEWQEDIGSEIHFQLGMPIADFEVIKKLAEVK